MKRILCLALVLLMLLPMVIACKKDEESTETGGSDVSAESGSESETVIDLLDTIPVEDYEGRDFIIAVETEHEAEVKADELTGDLANDTIYQWLQRINSRYNVKVKGQVPDGDFFIAQKKEASSGYVQTAIYGVNCFHQYIPVTARLYKNWYKMGDLIDLGAERWDQKVNDGVTWNGVLYGLTGDLGYSKLQGAMATYFNVGLLDKIGYTPKMLYDMVENKQWTFEKLRTIVKDYYLDSDYNGKKSGGDTYGFVATSGNAHDVWLVQFGISITSQNEVTHELTPTLKNDANETIVKMLWSFYHENEGVFSHPGVEDYGDEYVFFQENRAAMIISHLTHASVFAHQLGTEAFGILPAPMQNEDQADYYTKLYDRFVTWGVSKNILDGDIDFIAHITDALCAESSQTVYPKFYDILLKQRYSKDPDTAKMVDIIMKNVSIDSTQFYAAHLNAYPMVVREILWGATPANLSSRYDGIAPTLPRLLQDLYDMHDDT